MMYPDCTSICGERRISMRSYCKNLQCIQERITKDTPGQKPYQRLSLLGENGLAMFESRVQWANVLQIAWHIAPQDSKVFDFNKQEALTRILAKTDPNSVQKRRSCAPKKWVADPIFANSLRPAQRFAGDEVGCFRKLLSVAARRCGRRKAKIKGRIFVTGQTLALHYPVRPLSSHHKGRRDGGNASAKKCLVLQKC